MGTYTKTGGGADQLVADALDVVVAEIVRAVPGLRSVLLAGGFGRGEGSVELRDGGPRLINDFDIYIITRRYVPDDYLEEMATRCSALIGKGGQAYEEAFEERYTFERFFHVDIRCLVESRLRLLPPSIRYFELRHAAVLWGDDLRSRLPQIAPADLPRPEGLRLLMNRMTLLIMAFHRRFIVDPDSMSEDERGILAYYVAKGYLAIAEALLLFADDYRPTYTERAAAFGDVFVARYPELARRLPDLPQRATYYTDYKFAPHPADVDVLAEWEHCRVAVGEVYRHCLASFIGRPLPDSWAQTAEVAFKVLPDRYFAPYAANVLRRYHLPRLLTWPLARAAEAFLSYKYATALRRHLGRFFWPALSLRDPGVKMLALAPLVLFAVGLDGSEDRALLDYVHARLRRLYPVRGSADWDNVKSMWLRTFRVYYLQHFV